MPSKTQTRIAVNDYLTDGSILIRIISFYSTNRTALVENCHTLETDWIGFDILRKDWKQVHLDALI